jgi:hypothetical protein
MTEPAVQAAVEQLDAAVEQLDGVVDSLEHATETYSGPRDDRPRALWLPERRTAVRELLDDIDDR